MSHAEVEAEAGCELYYRGFGKADRGGSNIDFCGGFDGGLGGQVGHALEGFDEFGAAVGVSGIIERVDADENVRGLENLGPGQREGEEDGVARGNVSDRNFLAHLGSWARLGHGDVAGERGMAELAEVEGDDAVLSSAEAGSNASGAIELDAVALAVVEGEGVAVEAIAAGERQAGGGIESTTQEADSLG